MALRRAENPVEQFLSDRRENLHKDNPENNLRRTELLAQKYSRYGITRGFKTPKSIPEKPERRFSRQSKKNPNMRRTERYRGICKCVVDCKKEVEMENTIKTELMLAINEQMFKKGYITEEEKNEIEKKILCCNTGTESYN